MVIGIDTDLRGALQRLTGDLCGPELRTVPKGSRRSQRITASRADRRQPIIRLDDVSVPRYHQDVLGVRDHQHSLEPPQSAIRPPILGEFNGCTAYVPRVRLELGLEPFGEGTPGCGGRLDILANGVPSLGNAGFELHVSGTSPGRSVLLVIGDAEDTGGSLLFGATFHIDFAPPAPATGLIHMEGLGGSDSCGSLVAPFPIPNDPAISGSYVFQAATLFPVSECGVRVATSRGLRVNIQ